MRSFEGLSHKEIRAAVASQLEEQLAGLKELTGEKKFATRIKKAAKLLTEDLEVKKAKTKLKKEDVVKKPLLRKVPKAPAVEASVIGEKKEPKAKKKSGPASAAVKK